MAATLASLGSVAVCLTILLSLGTSGVGGAAQSNEKEKKGCHVFEICLLGDSVVLD